MPALFVWTWIVEETCFFYGFPVQITLHREHTLLFQLPIGEGRDSPGTLSLL